MAKKTIVENGAKQDTLVSPAPVKDGFRAHIDDIFKQFATDEKKEFVLGRQTYTLDGMMQSPLFWSI